MGASNPRGSMSRTIGVSNGPRPISLSMNDRGEYIISFNPGGSDYGVILSAKELASLSLNWLKYPEAYRTDAVQVAHIARDHLGEEFCALVALEEL